MQTTSTVPLATSSHRIQSIDIVRGIVMIIMALDHTRDYFHFDALIHDPQDLEHTTPLLFVTRWITNLCAPTFILLAGTSAYLVSVRKGKWETSRFLLTRGLWLVFIQYTIVIFAWQFDLTFSYNCFDIISTIGICMIALALLIHLPVPVIITLSLAMIFGHNLFDNVVFENATADFIWSLFHRYGMYVTESGFRFEIAYPLIPWIGVIAMGYLMGSLYANGYDRAKRKKLLLIMGLAMLALFVALRALNVYGDPEPWSTQQNGLYTFLSFMKLAKYPPSLLFLLPTFGITMLMLYLLDGTQVKEDNPALIFGRVPLFYYVVHLYVIHALALVAAVATGHSWQSMILYDWIANGAPGLSGSYGFSLGITYLVWMGIVALLFPICKKFYAFKLRNKAFWWTGYI